MQHHRFNEQDARLAAQGGAMGWCQYAHEKSEHGYLVLAALTDGTVRALDRTSWETLRRLGRIRRAS